MADVARRVRPAQRRAPVVELPADDGNDDDPSTSRRPLDVDLLALSSLGAWLDSRGAWPFRQPTGLSVEEWRHRATLGRDHYVRVVYAGFLFPFGHRASVVKITERQFHGETGPATPPTCASGCSWSSASR